MKMQIYDSSVGARTLKLGVSAIAMAALAACANYAGIHSDKQMDQPQQFETARGLPQERGRWPSADWIDQFGDAQLKALIAEALQGSPSVEQARARVDQARANSDTANAGTLPRVDASYTLTRQQYSGTALIPPPYAGSWQTENRGLLTASYDLDLWGKNREVLRAAVSATAASAADEQMVKLTLETSIARTYNTLARLYALRDIAQEEVTRREQIDRITASRIATGLDTQVERETAQANLATSRSRVSALDGRIRTTRYQLAALMGKGPDRGLTIRRPTLGVGDEVRLPDNLPADLVSRRPDIVAARWRVDAITHEVKEARAEFYPDINLSAAIGLDALGFGRFLRATSRMASVGPAIHLPIFDGGDLRAQLKNRYAEFDYAVAGYNQTLIGALSAVATELAQIRSSDAQLADAQTAQQAARDADRLAIMQYKSGLTNQLTVLNADVTALNADEAIANLKMDRRDEQIALASDLGGGYVDTSAAPGRTADRAAQSVPTAHSVAAASR
ncbi:MarR family transcriptional regulator [Burkholderia cepacia]|uniref:efflux transporter outer membrane subunit n=1 Tax=Burkholderia cepacia TaxID=292 RepID=UPI0007527186|nr:efflux transporter outer membrane subunit [Burkholderia cepacia]KVA30610.1 MarR family transcriptional regulator [Burkholderia cepacia]KVA35109.1 MarR family transcriptional regulator [Burkholderia cepacia]